MPSLDTLPTEIIEEIAQHLDVPPASFTQREQRFYPRRDLLSLASASKRMRRIFFDKTWVKEHVMDCDFLKLVRTAKVIEVSMRSEVETLVLRDNWKAIGSGPPLANYLYVFPNLSSIYIDLVFPFDRVVTHHSVIMPEGSLPSDTTFFRDPHRLTSVSLSLTKNIEATNCASHEWSLIGIGPAIQARLKQVGIDKLNAFHLDFVVDPMETDTTDPGEWIDIEEQIKEAHEIPAKKVTLDFKGIKVRGKVSEFLDALRNGIKSWPLGTDAIEFIVAIDDFGPGSELLDQFLVHANDQVTLSEGWIPTEDTMIAFVETVLEDRPGLQRFTLAILAGSDALQTSDEAWKQIFEFNYMTDDNLTLNRDRSDNSTVTPNDVNDMGDATAASIKAGMQSEPEINTIIGHAAIRALYDDALERLKQSPSESRCPDPLRVLRS